MKRFLFLSLALLTIVCICTKAQGHSVNRMDSLELEILKKLNDKTWNFWFIQEYTPTGKVIYQLELKDNITVSNHKLVFKTKKGIKSVSMTYGKISIGAVSGSPEKRLHVGDSLSLAKRDIRGSGGSLLAGVDIEASNKQIEDLYEMFMDYQGFPIAEMYEKELKEFQVIADVYRNTPDKPTVTEDQRRFIIQANSLNDEKLYSKALAQYKKAIEINPVSYPQAYYNMALIAALDKDYKYAIFNMKKYLLLLPDAEDARAAQDKIYEWEIK